MRKLLIAASALLVTALSCSTASAAQIRYAYTADLTGFYGTEGNVTTPFSAAARLYAYGDTNRTGVAWGPNQTVGVGQPFYNTVDITYAAVNIGPVSGAINANFFGGDHNVFAISNANLPAGAQTTFGRIAALTEIGTNGQLVPGGFISSFELGSWDGVSNLAPTRMRDLDTYGPGIDIALKNGILFDERSSANIYVSATILDGLSAENAFLPNAPADDGGYGFTFDAVSGQFVYIDPLVAVGYDYTLGAGSPLITKALLPNIAGSNYKIFALDNLGTSLGVTFQSQVNGLLVDFTSLAGGGIRGFRLTGINPNAALDPTNANAFVTGLSFASDGRVDITQTAISGGVPEPASWAMMLLGFSALGASLRARRARRLAYCARPA